MPPAGNARPPAVDGRPARWALVAGATGCVGRAVADGLAAAGSDVVVHSGHRPEAATALARGLAERHGCRAVAVHADVTDANQLGALREDLGRAGVASLAVLVNCVTASAGVPPPASRVDAAEFRRVLDVDLVGSFLLVRALLPLLVAEGTSKIILLTPRVEPRSGPNAVHLSAAKAGVYALVSVLANEVDGFGVGVHALAPGPVVAPGPGRPSGLPQGATVSTTQEVARVVLELAAARNGEPIGRMFGAADRGTGPGRTPGELW
jgi:NAD(P)-dependent dehydrogenase (short-subunit alcohol dehydrogenase family)